MEQTTQGLVASPFQGHFVKRTLAIHLHQRSARGPTQL